MASASQAASARVEALEQLAERLVRKAGGSMMRPREIA